MNLDDQAKQLGEPVLLDADSIALVRQLQAEETRRTGFEPDPISILRKALAALRASQLGDARKAAVVAALLEFGKSLSTHEVRGEPSFTEDPEANRLVIEDGFAFLLGVIFDQNVPAERAWGAPFELKRRLGHLDPARIVAEPDRVAKAVQQPPKLHRYINKLPDWIVAAADRVLRDYGGKAETIWADQPSAEALRQRLDQFKGIDQKKAAMAVEILERDLHVSIVKLEGSDIAYDIHVRRVFLRTGLALFDDPDHMIAIARQANVARPGAIDFPAWTVGRNWCRAGIPDCPACPITEACPKLVERGDAVKGV